MRFLYQYYQFVNQKVYKGVRKIWNQLDQKGQQRMLETLLEPHNK